MGAALTLLAAACSEGELVDLDTKVTIAPVGAAESTQTTGGRTTTSTVPATATATTTSSTSFDREVDLDFEVPSSESEAIPRRTGSSSPGDSGRAVTRWSSCSTPSICHGWSHQVGVRRSAARTSSTRPCGSWVPAADGPQVGHSGSRQKQSTHARCTYSSARPPDSGSLTSSVRSRLVASSSSSTRSQPRREHCFPRSATPLVHFRLAPQRLGSTSRFLVVDALAPGRPRWFGRHPRLVYFQRLHQ